MAKYPYAVKFNGIIYPANTEIKIDSEVPDETAKQVPDETAAKSPEKSKGKGGKKDNEANS